MTLAYTLRHTSGGASMAAIGSQAVAARVKFAGYELDLRSGELSSEGRRVRLQDQPFRLLKVLLENAGEVVTREELQRQLWPAETFVDFDHGLNKAIAKLRDVLDDQKAELSLIETLPRRGYRFTATVEWVPARTATNDLSGPVAVPSLTARPPRRRMLLALAGTCLLIVAAVVLLRYEYSRSARRPTIHSIAVLPLVNLSGDHSQDYFADGMTDELITMLAKNTSLRVVSRTSVMRYKGVSRPVHEIARELGSDGILEGSISRSANRVHLTVQLVQGENDAHIWAESYDRDPSDALLLLSELSQTIAKEVKAATSPQIQRQKEINPAAHDAYLRGRFFWYDVSTGQSQDFFEKAIQLQPDYAAAWSGLADAYTVKAVAGNVPSEEIRARAEAAARKALELDDTVADGHHSMAAVQYFLEWNWKLAETESLRDLQLNPNGAEVHHLRSYILGTLNRGEESLLEQRKASELDPNLRPWALGRALIRARQYDAAIKELLTREQVYPHTISIRYLLADAYHYAGLESESVRVYQEIYRSDNDSKAADAIEQEFHRGGARGVALWRLNRWKKISSGGYADPYTTAAFSARAELKEDALRALETAYQQRSAELVWIQNDPEFDFLHSEPRYRAIVQKMGLPAAY